MSFLILAFLCLFIGLPIVISLAIRGTLSKQTEDPFLTLHQERLEALARDKQAGLMDQHHYDAARIETERDIINHISTPPPSLSGAGHAHRIIGISTLVLVPLVALLLYALHGQPFLGPHPEAALPAGAFHTSPIAPPASTMAPTHTSGGQP